jgi:hypothetical protein
MYVFIAVGLAVQQWPGILNPPADIPHMGTVVGSVLGAVTLLAVLGIRYLLKMLPLLFFELLWKVMWVLMWGLPPQRLSLPKGLDGSSVWYPSNIVCDLPLHRRVSVFMEAADLLARTPRRICRIPMRLISQVKAFEGVAQ